MKGWVFLSVVITVLAAQTLPAVEKPREPEKCWDAVAGEIECVQSDAIPASTEAAGQQRLLKRLAAPDDLFSLASKFALFPDRLARWQTGFTGQTSRLRDAMNSFWPQSKLGETASATDIIRTQGFMNSSQLAQLETALRSVSLGTARQNGLTAVAGGQLTGSILVPASSLTDFSAAISRFLRSNSIGDSCTDPLKLAVLGNQIYASSPECASKVRDYLNSAGNRFCMTVLYTPPNNAAACLTGFSRIEVDGKPGDCYADVSGGCRASVRLYWRSSQMTTSLGTPSVCLGSTCPATSMIPVQFTPTATLTNLFNNATSEAVAMSAFTSLSDIPLADLGYVDKITFSFRSVVPPKLSFDSLVIALVVPGQAFGLSAASALWLDMFVAAGAPPQSSLFTTPASLIIPLLPVSSELGLLFEAFVSGTATGQLLSPANFCPSNSPGRQLSQVGSSSSISTSVFFLPVLHFIQSYLRSDFDNLKLGCISSTMLEKADGWMDAKGAIAFQNQVGCQADPFGAMVTNGIAPPGSTCPATSITQTPIVYRFLFVLHYKLSATEVNAVTQECKRRLDALLSQGIVPIKGPFTADRDDQEPMNEFRVVFATLTEPDALLVYNQYKIFIKSYGKVDIAAEDNEKFPLATDEGPLYCPAGDNINAPALRRRAIKRAVLDEEAAPIFRDISNIRAMFTGSGIHIHMVESQRTRLSIKKDCCVKYKLETDVPYPQEENDHSYYMACLACSAAPQANLHMYHPITMDSNHVIYAFQVVLQKIDSIGVTDKFHLLSVSFKVPDNRPQEEIISFRDAFANIDRAFADRQVIVSHAAGNDARPIDLTDKFHSGTNAYSICGIYSNPPIFWPMSNHGPRCTLMMPVDGFNQQGTSAGPPRFSGALALALSELSSRVRITQAVKREIFSMLKPMGALGMIGPPLALEDITVQDIPQPMEFFEIRGHFWWQGTCRPRMVFSAAEMGLFVDRLYQGLLDANVCVKQSSFFCFGI